MVSPVKADPNWDNLQYTLFRDMQAVLADGSNAWSVPTIPPDDEQAYKLRGVVLNNPEDLLDGTPNYIPCGPGTEWQLGAMWQVFIQYVDNPNISYDDDDFGGAALWMGQNYGNHAWHHPDSSYSYSDAEWTAEIDRLSLGGTLQAGDLIEVHARGGLFHAGKFNVNEQHDNDPAFDFDIIRLDVDQMPAARTISLSDVKNPDDGFRFVQDRLSGAEHYQATWVRLENVRLVDPAGWGPDAELAITDGTYTLPLKLGRTGFDAMQPPAGPFDVLGIFDQEGWNLQGDYRLWVPNADRITIIPEPGGIVLAIGAAMMLFLLRFRRRWLRRA